MFLESIRKNIIAGFRMAIFLPAQRHDFVVSWAMLAFALFFSMISQFLIEYAVFWGEGEFNEYSWYGFHFEIFVLTFLCSFWIAFIFYDSEKILTVVVMFYYSLLVFFIPYYFVFATNEDWMTKPVVDFIDTLVMIWGFLIMFRIIGLIYPSIANLQILGALSIPLMFFVLDEYMYLGHFFYQQEEAVEQSAFEKLTDEEVFAVQDEMLDDAFKNVKSSKKGQVAVYLISFGSYSYQDVFMKEAKFVTSTLEERFKLKDRTITLINNQQTFFEYPLANRTNLNGALKRLSKIMQPNEDILILYFTSHGAPVDGLSVNIRGRTMQDANGADVDVILEPYGIKNKVIFISACFSGTFIDYLKDDNTLIMTSAAQNKQSYGCSDDADLTYFAEAYFKDGLNSTTNLIKAFDVAEKKIKQREVTENLPISSKPQIFIGKNIEAQLKKYKAVKLSD